MLVLLQVDTVSETPFKVMVLLPLLAPKLIPEIVTTVPDPPDEGDRLLMQGAELLRAKQLPLLATPFTLTTT